MRIFRFAVFVALAAGVAAQPAAAGFITPDYTNLGTVYQDTAGVVYDAPGAGRFDNTASFKANVSAAISLLEGSILIPNWTETVSFTLASIPGAVGDSAINSVDANGRPLTSTIRYATGGPLSYFDPNPNPSTNAGFAMSSKDAMLGGGLVNVSRFGNAVLGGPADGRYDLFTVIIHELLHSLGYSSGLDRFINLVGATGTPDRSLLVPATLTGLPQDFSIPFVSFGAHIDGVVLNGLFNDTVVADPGFGPGQRALPTAAELYGIGVIEGASAGQINSNLTVTPEPGSLLLATVGIPCLILYRRLKKGRGKRNGLDFELDAPSNAA